MADVASLHIGVDSRQVRTAANDLDNLSVKSRSTARAADALAASQDRVSASMNGASRAEQEAIRYLDQMQRELANVGRNAQQIKAIEIRMAAAAVKGTELEREIRSVGAALIAAERTAMRSSGGIARLGKTSGLASHQVLNLSYQAQDLGVQLASGANPLTAFVQQGSQIAGIMQQSQLGVMGFTRAVVGLIATTTAALVMNPIFLSIAGAITAVTLAANFMADDISEASGVSVTASDVILGAFDVLRDTIAGSVTSAFAAFGLTTSQVWDYAVSVTRTAINWMIGAITMLPRVFINAFSVIPQAIDKLMSGDVVGAFSLVGSEIATAVTDTVQRDYLGDMADAIGSAATNRALQREAEEAGKKTGQSINEGLRSALSFIEQLREEIARIGETASETRVRLAEQAALAAEAEGLTTLAAAIRELSAQREAAYNAEAVNDFAASIEEFNRETARQRNAIGLTSEELEIYNLNMERNARIAAVVSLATADNTEAIREQIAALNDAYDARKKVIEAEQDHAQNLKEQADAAKKFEKSIKETRRQQEEFNETLRDTVGLLDNLFGLNGDLLTLFDSDAFKDIRKEFGDLAKEFADMFGMSLKQLFEGAQMGAAMGRMFAGISDAVGLPSSKTGGQIGGALGSVFGPAGAAVGSIVGSLSVGLLKGTKKASATIETLASNEVQVSIQGNSKKLKEVADSMATSVINGLMDIADAFGGSLLEGIQISIGQRNKKFVVDPTGMGRTKGSGVLKFKDEEDAIAYATKLALENGVIAGIRDTTQRLLQEGDDLQSALQDALDFEGVFDRLLEKTDPLAFGLQQLEEEFDRLTALFDKAGASAAEYADLQQLYELERQEIIDKAAQEQLDKQHEITNMIVRLYEEQGLAAEALALTRQMELEKANETEKAILRQIYAVEDFNKARAEETQELESTIQTMRQLSDSLRGFRDSLYAADGGVTNYKQALVELMKVGSLAATGDTQALAALQGTSQTFLEASRSRAASAFEYQKDVALVARYVDQGIAAADQQVSAAEQQLTLLEQQLAQLVDLNGNIESLIEATTTPVSAPNSGMVYDWNTNIASNSGTEERLDQMDGTLRDHLYAIAKNTNATAKLLDRWDGDGQPDIRELSSDYY